MIQRAVPPNLKSLQSGMGLLEVLVAIVILGVGALGIAGLQARALKGNESSLQRSQAVLAGNYIMEAIRADSTLVGQTGMLCATGSNTVGLWIKDLQATMGSTACGSINCQANARGNLCTVQIQWNDSRAKGSETQNITLSTLL